MYNTVFHERNNKFLFVDSRSKGGGRKLLIPIYGGRERGLVGSHLLFGIELVNDIDRSHHYITMSGLESADDHVAARDLSYMAVTCYMPLHLTQCL